MKIPWEGQKASAFGVGLSGSNSTHPCTLPKSGICVFPYLLHGAICREQVALFLVMRVLGGEYVCQRLAFYREQRVRLVERV